MKSSAQPNKGFCKAVDEPLSKGKSRCTICVLIFCREKGRLIFFRRRKHEKKYEKSYGFIAGSDDDV